jgi:hypothetical protein
VPISASVRALPEARGAATAGDENEDGDTAANTVVVVHRLSAATMNLFTEPPCRNVDQHPYLEHRCCGPAICPAEVQALRKTKAPPGRLSIRRVHRATKRAPRRQPPCRQAVCGAGRTARLRPFAPYQASSRVTVWRWRLRMMSMIGPWRWVTVEWLACPITTACGRIHCLAKSSSTAWVMSPESPKVPYHVVIEV